MLCRCVDTTVLPDCRASRRAVLPFAFPAVLTAAHKKPPNTSAPRNFSVVAVGAGVGGLHQQHSLAVSDAMILAAVGDIYDGININAEELPADPVAFADSLRQSLQVSSVVRQLQVPEMFRTPGPQPCISSGTCPGCRNGSRPGARASG